LYRYTVDVMLEEADEGGELLVGGEVVPHFRAGDAVVGLYSCSIQLPTSRESA
jgi:hypothetical protein